MNVKQSYPRMYCKGIAPNDTGNSASRPKWLLIVHLGTEVMQPAPEPSQVHTVLALSENAPSAWFKAALEAFTGSSGLNNYQYYCPVFPVELKYLYIYI